MPGGSAASSRSNGSSPSPGQQPGRDGLVADLRDSAPGRLASDRRTAGRRGTARGTRQRRPPPAPGSLRTAGGAARPPAPRGSRHRRSRPRWTRRTACSNERHSEKRMNSRAVASPRSSHGRRQREEGRQEALLLRVVADGEDVSRSELGGGVEGRQQEPQLRARTQPHHLDVQESDAFGVHERAQAAPCRGVVDEVSVVAGLGLDDPERDAVEARVRRGSDDRLRRSAPEAEHGERQLASLDHRRRETPSPTRSATGITTWRPPGRCPATARGGRGSAGSCSPGRAPSGARPSVRSRGPAARRRCWCCPGRGCER